MRTEIVDRLRIRIRRFPPFHRPNDHRTGQTTSQETFPTCSGPLRIDMSVPEMRDSPNPTGLAGIKDRPLVVARPAPRRLRSKSRRRRRNPRAPDPTVSPNRARSDAER